jgi:hypothetical protein
MYRVHAFYSNPQSPGCVRILNCQRRTHRRASQPAVDRFVAAALMTASDGPVCGRCTRDSQQRTGLWALNDSHRRNCLCMWQPETDRSEAFASVTVADVAVFAVTANDRPVCAVTASDRPVCAKRKASDRPVCTLCTDEY